MKSLLISLAALSGTLVGIARADELPLQLSSSGSAPVAAAAEIAEPAAAPRAEPEGCEAMSRARQLVLGCVTSDIPFDFGQLPDFLPQDVPSALYSSLNNPQTPAAQDQTIYGPIAAEADDGTEIVVTAPRRHPIDDRVADQYYDGLAQRFPRVTAYDQLAGFMQGPPGRVTTIFGFEGLVGQYFHGEFVDRTRSLLYGLGSPEAQSPHDVNRNREQEFMESFAPNRGEIGIGSEILGRLTPQQRRQLGLR